jgi:hypothetical protein
LECLPILLVGCIFNSDSVITLVDFMVLLHFSLALFWYIFKSRKGSWVGDILGDVILQNATWVSATTPDQSVLKGRGLNYIPGSADESRRTRELGKECKAAHP